MSKDTRETPEGMRRVRERLERHYEFERWAGPEPGAELAALPTPGPYRPEPPAGFILQSERGHHSRYHGEEARSYVFKMEGGRREGGPAVQVVVVRCSTPEAARSSVMDVLASQMAVRLEPAVSLGIGDVAFAPPGEGPTFIVFASGSLAILVQSVGTVPVPVDAFARVLTRQ